MANPKFLIKKSTDDQHYFNLIAGNGEIIFTSELYTARANAESGIASVRENAPHDDGYNRLTSGAQFYFTLQARNGEILGTSELYTTKAKRDEGIETVKRLAPIAPAELER